MAGIQLTVATVIEVESVTITLRRKIGRGARWGLRIKNPDKLRVRVRKASDIDAAPLDRK